MMVASGLVGLAGLVVTPMSAGAAVAPSGHATASALTLNISPQALLTVPPQVLSALDQLSGQNVLGINTTDLVTTLKNALTQTTTLDLDYSDAQATLNQLVSDLTGGSATSTAVRLQLQGLDQVLIDLKAFLNGLLAPVSSQLQSALGTLTQQLGPAHPVVQQLTQLTGLPLTVQSLLDNLGNVLNGVNLNKTLSVVLDQQPQRIDLLTLPAPLNLSLAPFEAAVLSSRGVQQWGGSYGVGSPQATAFNTTTALSLVNQLGLPSINVSNLGSQVGALLGTVTQQLTALTGGGSSVVGTVCSSLGSLPGLGGAITQTCSTVQSSASQATTQLTAQLQTLQSSLAQLNSTLTSMQPLNNLLAALPQIQLNSLVQTSGLTSTALSQPLSHGVNVVATSKFVDVQVLPLNATLANLLSAATGTALLEIKGVTAHAGAFVNGIDTSAPTGDSGLAEIDVLGKPVVTADSLIPQGTSKTIAVPTPVGTLSLVLSRGVPQLVNNTAQHKTATIAALNVRLDWTPSAANAASALPILGPGGSIVDLCAGCAQVDAAMTPQAAASSPAVPLANPLLPKTGMVGPAGFAAAAVLGLAAVPLRLWGRRRRVATHRGDGS